MEISQAVREIYRANTICPDERGGRTARKTLMHSPTMSGGQDKKTISKKIRSDF